MEFRLTSPVGSQAPVPLSTGVAPGPSELHASLGTVPAAGVAGDPAPQTPGATLPLPQPSATQLPTLAWPDSGAVEGEG